MNYKGYIAFGLALALGLLSTQPVFALGETQVVLVTQITSQTPVFSPGREGDMTAIIGFNFSGDLMLGEAVVGESTGEAIFVNPPLNLAQPYSQALVRLSNTLTGLGSFDVVAQGVSLDSSTTPTQGDVLISYAGSVHNGSGGLANLTGLTSGIGNTNIFVPAGQVGTITATYLIRFGF